VDRALPPSLEELREHSRERLARFKAPRELNVVDALPRTSSGKLRRAAVPRRATDQGP
jgi:acyl-coenzyme A synthetase/AMP-(fatty) acid ligase